MEQYNFNSHQHEAFHIKVPLEINSMDKSLSIHLALEKNDNIPQTIESLLKTENIQRAVDKELIVA